MFIIKVVVIVIFSIIVVHNLIGSILHHIISIANAIVIAFVLLVLVVFIFHKSSIVHKS